MKRLKTILILLISLFIFNITVFAIEDENAVINNTEITSYEEKDNTENIDSTIDEENINNIEETNEEENEINEDEIDTEDVLDKEESSDKTNIIKEKNRNDLDNYGVNKKWKINDTNKYNVLNTPLVDSSLKIYDYSNLLTENEKELLLKRINEVSKKIKMEIVIVTKDLSYYNDSENETFAADFYDYNDFGIDLDKYSGILLFRNTYSFDPYYNIYTFGNAQLYFSYNRLESILDNIYDDLHNKNYYDGFLKYINEIERYYDSGIPSEMKSYSVDDMGYLVKHYRIPFLPCLLISSIITFIIIFILIKKNKMIAKKTEASDYVDKNSINITKRLDTFLTTHTSSYTVSSSSSSSGGGHSSSGSSGGGHSSGGGRHG